MRFLFIPLLVPVILAGQVPRIGIIDTYGIRKVPEEKVRKAVGVGEGDTMPASKAAIEERIAALSGVVRAQIEAVCCEDGKAILYVGIEEKGAPHFDFHSYPSSQLQLPAGLLETYRSLMAAVRDAARNADTAEDLTGGYSLMANPECRALQEKLMAAATPNLEILRQVLHDAEDPEQRAVAAYALAYAPKKQEVIDDLQWAMQDADGAVRANAMSSLKAANVLATLRPNLGIRISRTWFVEMLNSIDWNDRRRAASALVTLTEKRDRSTMEELRQRALPALIEMARWKNLAHALPAYILLGRVAGMQEDRIEETWSHDRDAGYAEMMRMVKKK